MTDPAGTTDITDRADVEALLRRFYGQVLVDDVLGVPFTQVREVSGLDSHIPLMADFWETVLFHAGLYRGSPLPAHLAVHDRTPLAGQHFVRWLSTWVATIDAMYRGPMARRAKTEAARIAWAMHRKLTGVNADELDALVATTRR
ncbi:group III truncated hemoglobin [Mycolicibacillus parakoreensis]|uniref:Group III truncated hemoglobin n=1 Tax=Mycolicibacillus parakoreensis TaxID=1069221 RepID=A0ABY3U0X2_9MYCO|nr:group III truncated hemoglobin [Mycolicibacillus parakoreensis]MCV7315028.1 group III truncated hemoglobin [Mycolicibacillus parakoreensis]ULN53613.1 group III truncated hemoglobin [Mycolicibacillus parakoreensis]